MILNPGLEPFLSCSVGGDQIGAVDMRLEAVANGEGRRRVDDALGRAGAADVLSTLVVVGGAVEQRPPQVIVVTGVVDRRPGLPQPEHAADEFVQRVLARLAAESERYPTGRQEAHLNYAPLGPPAVLGALVTDQRARGAT